MLCCSNPKKQKMPKQQNANSLPTHLNQQEESLNINDEACTIPTILQIQQNNTIQISKLSLERQTISRSNSRRNNDNVAQTALVQPIRKTPFFTFNKSGTHSFTKYLSTKQGYTLLVTPLSY